MRVRSFSLALALPLLACEAPPGAAVLPSEVHDLRYFLRRLHELEHLPELEAGTTALSSTWDRTGGNGDAWDFKQIEGNRNILFDADGPGCLHRIRTGLVGDFVRGTRIQIFLDGAESPLLDLPVDELFSETAGPLPYPLVSRRTYPGSHFPIPFAKHCRVQLVSDARRWGGYWQIAYSRYPKDTPVVSLRLPLGADEQAELERVLGAWSLAQTLPPSRPEGARRLERSVRLAAGESESIVLLGAGVVRDLRVRVSPGSALEDVAMILRWDGSPSPAADLAVGDFFGHGAYRGDPGVSFSSLLLGVSRGLDAYSRFPMPFARGGEIVFRNRGSQPVQLDAEVSVEERQTLPASWGRFRVGWNRGKAALPGAEAVGPLAIPGHLVLDERGAGKYVGVMLQVDWPYPGWWGEGDWLVWSDEDGWPPSYHGTGSEEYFNSGWTLFDRSAISGFIRVQPGPVAVYSFHLGDAFQFRRSIRVVTETVGSFGGEETIAKQHPSWGSAAFWYAAPD